MPDTEAPEPILTLDQRRRVEALQVARATLENRPDLFAGSKVEASRAVYDLTYLADWIIDGPMEIDPDDRTLPDDRSWYRRQGYVDGVKASAMYIAAGGQDLNQLLGDDAIPVSELDTTTDDLDLPRRTEPGAEPIGDGI